MNTRFWRIDKNAGTVGCPSVREEVYGSGIQEIECTAKPEYLQIEHSVSFMSFLTWEDIEIIDEVNDQKGSLIEAVLNLKVGESYHDSEANVTIVKL